VPLRFRAKQAGPPAWSTPQGIRRRAPSSPALGLCEVGGSRAPPCALPAQTWELSKSSAALAHNFRRSV
jgi:hypothetical protein